MSVIAAWRHTLAIVAAFATPIGLETAAFAQDRPMVTASGKPFPVPEGIEARHPSEMLDLAEQLFATEDGKEAGLFWYYVGELRWKTLAGCTEPFTFDDMKQMSDRLNEVGAPIKAWSGDHLDTLLATLDKVEAWDLATTDHYAKGQGCEAEAALLRGTIPQLKTFIEDYRAQQSAQPTEP